MGFDNECIVDIQSLAGEYFCPVCRLLVYPNEALQSQCTHLYCKPCLTYIVGTTRACPYDGYLVTEADSKPLVESNKALGETIGKIAVRCLYHRSGCQWQGPLSDCTSHCSGCAFGNSPVVCNRCAIQIVHRQVQEHAQSCPGVQPQATRVEGTQNVAATVGATSASVEHPQTAAQSGASNSAAQTSQTGPTAPTGQDPNLQSTVNTQVHGVAPAAVPPPEQMYQQQYQQYYQQYPGYDPYHQAYQNYYPYQQQPQGYSQPQPQQQSTIQSQTLVQAQALPQAQVQAQTQAHVQPQSLQQVPAAVTAQASVNPQYQTHLAAQPPTQLLPQAHPPTHGYPHPQPQFHTQSYAGGQPHPQPRPIQPQSQQMQMSQYPQPQPQIQLHNPQIQPQPHSQIQTQAHPQAHPLHQNIPQHQAQLPHAHPQHQPMNQSVNPNAQSQTQQPLAHAVTGHHSYPQSQVHQHMQLGAQQRPNIHPQSVPIPQLPSQTHGPFPQQPPQMGVVPQSHPPAANLQLPVQLPPQGQVPSIPPAQQRPVNSYAQQPGHPTHQHPVMQPMQQLMPQPHMPHQQVFPGQASGPVQNQLHPRGQHMQLPPPPPLHPQLLPQGPSGLQPQQPQNYSARPVMPNHEAQLQPFGQSPARYTSQAQGRPPQLGANQQLSNQNHPLRTNNHVQISSEPQAGQSGMTLKPKVLERLGDHMLEKSVADKKNDSPSQKTAEKEPNGLAPALDTGIDSIEAKNIKLEMDVKLGRDEDVNRQVDIRDKDMVSELHVAASSSAQPASNGGMSSEVVAAEPKDEADISQQGEKLKLDDSSKEQSGKFPKDATDVVGVDKGVQSVPMAAAHISDSSARSEKSLTGRDHVQPGLHERNFGQSHGQVLSLSSAHPTYPFPPADQGRSPGMPIHYPSSHQQRPAGPVMLQPALPPGPPHLTQVPGKLPNVSRPQGPGHLPQSGQPLYPPPDHFQPPVLSQHHGSPFGRTPSQFGPHDRNLETQPVDFQGHYGQGRFPPPHSGAPRMSTGEPTGSFNSLGGIMGRPPLYGAEGHIGQQRPINPVGNENFSDHRSRYLDGQSPGTKSQVRNLKEDSSLTVGLNDDRFKRFTEEGSNRFPMEPAWRSDRVSRPLDKEPFGLNSDVGLKLDPGAARVLPSYHPGTNDAGDRAPPGGPDGNIERGDFAHTRPDFLGPVPGFGRHHMDRFASRSPGRENSGFPSRDLGGLPGFPRNQLGLDEFEGHESRPFDGPRSFKFPPDSAGNLFPESRFPPLPGHFQRGELDGPGFLRNNDLIGDDVPSHLRRGEFHGPRNLPGHLGFGDPAGFGAFPGHARRGDLAGPENFPHHLPFGEQFGGNMSGHPNHGDRGFRSSYPSGGSLDPFDNSRKRKPPSNGWCRICKVDCESVEGLELHSQTREHQDMAMDMVRSIKLQNAKKQKISNDRSSLEEPSKLRGSGYEVRGNRR